MKLSRIAAGERDREEEKIKKRLQNEKELRLLCEGHNDGVYSQNFDEQIVIVGHDQTYISMNSSNSFLTRWS